MRSKFGVILTPLLLISLVLAACGSPAQQTAVTKASTQAVPAVNTVTTIATKAAPVVNTVVSGAATQAAPVVNTVTGGTTASSCSNTGGSLLIYSSMPMTGPSSVNTISAVNGMKMALSEHNGMAGGYKVNFQALDDATAAAQKWTSEQESANANKAIHDGASVYLGTFNSGAAAVSIPILNRTGIPMISPANTAINLTVPGPPDPNLYNSLYKSGPRNYFRVVPNDRIQGSADANWAKTLGAQKVYVLNDQETYGKGVADVFEATAKQIGLQVVGSEGIDPKAGSYASLAQKIQNRGANLVFFGGLVETGAPQLLKDLRDVQPDPKQLMFMGPDGIVESTLISGAGQDTAQGTYGSVAAAPPASLSGPGQQFYQNYKKTYGKEPEPYAIFGHDAMLAALLAIDKACSKDPKAILKALNNLGTVHGALGTWHFDKNGDTSLKDYYGYIVKGSDWQFAQKLSAAGSSGATQSSTPASSGMQTPAAGTSGTASGGAPTSGASGAAASGTAPASSGTQTP